MISKNDVLASIEDEIRIIKHLATKIPPGRTNWRPTEGQRSVLELLQYLSHTCHSAMLYIVDESGEKAKAASEASNSVTLQNFHRAMDAQGASMRKMIQNVSASDFANRDTKLFWGTPVKLGRAFMDIGIKFLACYRMQLFLYLKQMGVSEIGTAQCWVGVDPEPKPQEA